VPPLWYTRPVTEIKRMGPPAARDVRDKSYIWTLPLNRMPDKEWKHFFGDTKNATIVCSPWKVSFYQGQMIFESAEEHLVTWIKFIDTWMAVANKRYAEYEVEQERRRGGTDKDTRGRDERIAAMNEKFKHL
jgi:hypothetical protein